MEGRHVQGGPCSKTKVNNLLLPRPQREARLQWKTSSGSCNQAGPSFPWFCPDLLWISWANSIKPPPLLLRGPARVPEQPVWSCLPRPHPAPPKRPVLPAPRALPVRSLALARSPLPSFGFLLPRCASCCRPGPSVRHLDASSGLLWGIYLNGNWVINWVITGFMSVPPPLLCTRAET